MMDFLSWLRDAFTVCFFAFVMIYMATWEFRQEMRKLFPRKEQPKTTVKPVKTVKFNGSAATWVK